MENIKKLMVTEVSFGTYKILAVHLVAVIFLIWIIFGHALCSCCRTSLFEGFQYADAADADAKAKETKEAEANAETFKNLDEGFENKSNATFGPNYLSNFDSTFVIEPSKWSYSGGATPTIAKPNYTSQSKDSSQMNIIENMKFAPECCPSSYSSSQGCACMSDDTLDFLASRGGNN